MKVLIIGEGKVLYFLTRTFLAKGHTVGLVSNDREECARLARQLKAEIFYGDGSDPALLEDAGIHGTDVVIAVMPQDQDNLAVALLAKKEFEVPRVLAMVNDPENEEGFRALGLNVFSTIRTLASLVEQQAELEEITNLIPVGAGRVNVTEVLLPVESPVAGKALQETGLPPDCLVAVILREGAPLVPRGATRLEAGDRLVLITLPENHGPVLRALTGERR